MAYFGEELQRTAGRGSSVLRDFRHAAQIFRPEGYALAPKFKFLFHTFFDINPTVFESRIEQGILVKSVKLPSFSIKTHELNQYNRKRIVQTKIAYDPVSITFHDDNSNVITKMWDAYYSYYYKDPTNINVFRGQAGTDVADRFPGGNTAQSQNYNVRNIYDQSITGNNNWGYIGESSSATDQQVKLPFFRNITVFGFNRHTFTAYTLVNPMIQKLDHDSYNYSESAGTMEIKMDIVYETAVYNEGAMDGRTPGNIIQGFAVNGYYDKQASPITPAGKNSPVPGPSGYTDPRGGYIKSLKG